MIIIFSFFIIVETLNLSVIQTNFVRVIIKMFRLTFISKLSQAIVNPLSTKFWIYSGYWMNFL